MKTIEHSHFETEQAAHDAAQHFLQVWGGDEGWNPYGPKVLILPPSPTHPTTWQLVAERYASAE